MTKALSEAAGTLSTARGWEQLQKGLNVAYELASQFAKDPCFQKEVLAELGEEAKQIFTDPYLLSEY